MVCTNFSTSNIRIQITSHSFLKSLYTNIYVHKFKLTSLWQPTEVKTWLSTTYASLILKLVRYFFFSRFPARPLIWYNIRNNKSNIENIIVWTLQQGTIFYFRAQGLKSNEREPSEVMAHFESRELEVESSCLGSSCLYRRPTFFCRRGFISIRGGWGGWVR